MWMPPIKSFLDFGSAIYWNQRYRIDSIQFQCIYFKGYTNVLKIDLKCPEKYIKAYIFFIIQWIEVKFENVKNFWVGTKIKPFYCSCVVF